MTNNTDDGNWSVRSVNVVGSIGLALLALSCGGNYASESRAAPAASVGDEPPPETAHTAAPAAAGRGYLTVQAKVAGSVVPASARFIRGEVAADFNLGEELSVESGQQRIEVTLTDDSALVDKPTRQLDVVVEPYQKTLVDAAFPWAKVQLKLLVQGKEQPPTAMKLLRDGNVVAEVKSGPPSFMVSPGNYEVEVALRGKSTRVKDLAFFESSEQIIPISAR